MREMTREQVVQFVRREIDACGGIMAYGRRRAVAPSTIANALHGRHRWTPYTLRLVGLAGVQVVEEGRARMESTPVSTRSTYRPMWRLGDWPSRYAVTREL